ncbi:L-aspartate oxidase [Arthrobacter psychrochitiniphilus]|uniref:L-aspartate oxidase n=1 Tax=Arthrobacter psychrochitiniphilus TaxID=291045 RepID=A0A2V3DPU7_9MICC|nr:L-aspartate oxidase [Arthrobacter psychrochitiniphilus]NYG18182.1 L-aspartate oxidase [Arthrobacter psychrochitiniphilus]PXA65012.1 L-aspartate oxidase [Arthrobacter psychrochitiniphilus]
MSARHLVVVGSGVAGLYATLLAAQAGVQVTLLTKGALAQSNTHQAQGGICAVLPDGAAAPGDTVEAHIADTLKAGAGECDPEAVRILCTEAAGDIAAIEHFGVSFDRDASGRRALGLEGAHSAARILHAGGDATGAAIANGLIKAVRAAAARGAVTLVEHAFVHDLLVLEGAALERSVKGVRYHRELPQGEPGMIDLRSDAVLLATGGAGQLFAATTNPAVATADGVALAWRAGAVVADLEYFQFHPTALAVGENFLISEAVRGAGAVLRDAAGEAFMLRYHPDGDLAPRDVVSRSIAAHLRNGRDGQSVYLDATGIEQAQGAGYLSRRFPTIAAKTQALGFDWTRERLPITPAAHYWMGGIATNQDGETSLHGLYAAGEAACTGVHGANRLASNSLLEGLVFGRRAVDAFLREMAAGTGNVGAQSSHAQYSHVQYSHAQMQLGGATPLSVHADALTFSKDALQALMSAHAGVFRDAQGLRHAAEVLAGWRSQREMPARTAVPSREEAEALNLLTVAQLLVHAALSRENSVGAHFRADFTDPPIRTRTASSRTASSSRAAARDFQHRAATVSHMNPVKFQRESETV